MAIEEYDYCIFIHSTALLKELKFNESKMSNILFAYE